MTEHRIGTQDEWQAGRDALLKEEKELTRSPPHHRPADPIPLDAETRATLHATLLTLAENTDSRFVLDAVEPAALAPTAP